jgi:hypothetical protein
MLTEKKETLVKKNIEMSFQFLEYLMDNPEELKKIPQNASVFILTPDDEDLLQLNFFLIEKALKRGEKIAVTTPADWVAQESEKLQDSMNE